MKLTQYLTKAVEYKHQQEEEIILSQKKDFAPLAGLPFYDWDKPITEQSNTFVGKIGLPVKNGITHPLYDYEKEIFDYLEHPELFTDDKAKHDHLAILKAGGLGITTLLLYYIAWKCIVNDSWNGRQVCILVGPREQLAIDILTRLKQMLSNITTFTTKETVAYINGCKIESYPSHLGMRSMRGIPNISMTLCDEASWFNIDDTPKVRDLIDRYVSKSHPKLCLVSTPQKIGDLMYQLYQEPEEECIYYRMRMDWKYGLNKIYTQEEMDIQQRSPSFPREFALSFEHNLGNIYSVRDIELAIVDKYSLAEEQITSEVYTRYMAIDPAFGSSEMGILIVQKKNGKLEVCYADTISRPSFSQAVEHIQQLIDRFPNISKILVDGSSPGLVKELKLLYQDMFPNYEKMKPDLIDKFISMSGVWICPINFSKNKMKLITHSVKILEKHYIRIDKSFDKLITSLRTAVATSNNTQYDKQASSYSDLCDCWQMISLLVTERG